MTAYEFLRECGVFYLLTVQDGAPAGRPFGAVMAHEGKLYISTGTTKDVYRQMKANPAVQIVAMKGGTRAWVRIDGRAAECGDIAMKRRMLEACPSLRSRYISAEDEMFALFAIEDASAQFNEDGAFVPMEIC